MSESKQKNNSKQPLAAPAKKLSPQQEAEQKVLKFRKGAIISVVILVVLFAVSLFINSNYFYTKATAVQVGDTSYTAAEFNFYFRSSYNNFLQQYGDYVSLTGLDTSKSLDEQMYSYSESGNQTWADHFTELALEQMEQTTALNNEAKKEGFTVSQDTIDQVESSISYISLYAQMNGIDVNTYLAYTYGKGMDEDYYRQTMLNYYTAVDFANSKGDSFTYTDEEIKAYYPEIADKYDVIDYHSYLVSTTLDMYTDMDDASKVEAAHNDAEAIIEGVDSPEEFTAKVAEFVPDDEKDEYTEPEDTLTHTSAGYISSAISEWLLDASRKEGDTTVIDSAAGSYALYFVSRDTNDYKTANVRHILIKAVADENNAYTDEALAEAKAKAEEVYAKWQEDPTEDNFIALVKEYSEDSSSVENGGLYEAIAKGQMVDEFDAFCFEGHQPGDTAIVYGSSDSYAGYHIVYYVGDGPIYADYLAETTMRNEDFNNYVLDLASNYTAETKFAFRFTNRK